MCPRTLPLMNMPGPHPRIAANALDFSRYEHLSREAWAVERREGENWKRIGAYGSLAEASAAIDEQVGLGHGSLEDFEMEHVPRPKRAWRPWGRKQTN